MKSALSNFGIWCMFENSVPNSQYYILQKYAGAVCFRCASRSHGRRHCHASVYCEWCHLDGMPCTHCGVVGHYMGRRSLCYATQAEARPPPPPQQAGPALQQGPLESAWHSIKGITARRRRYRGAPYEYKVVWQDDSSSWLPARDITPMAIKAYQLRHRKRRRQC